LVFEGVRQIQTRVKKLKGNTTVVKYFFFLPVRKIAPSDKIIIRG
jgi:hypothetical protein